MKLSKSEVEIMAGRIIDQLLENELIEVDDKDDAIQVLNDVITEDLCVEDKLNDEVRALLEQHSSDVDKSGLEFHRTFQMLKSRLVRERNLIL